jgi:multidrug efflux system membrane fusion protein
LKKQQLVATAIIVLVVVWLFIPRPASDADNESTTVSPATVTVLPADEAVSNETLEFVVRAARITAQTYTENVRVRGRTQAFRMVEVRAEQSGRVVATPALRGARVNTGDVLCEIAVDNRQADLDEAISRREQTRLEFTASQDLQRQGLQSQVALAQTKAAYDSAVAAVERATLALENTRIKAPFDGVVETRPVEIGDLLDRGGVCATVMDDDPMLLVGLVPEQDIGKIALGAAVNASLLTGEQVTGTVTYVGRAADAQSRSYRIEVEVSSDSPSIRDGITTEVLIAASQVQAHLIPASALTLDDNGSVGVKLLAADNRVVFAPVQIIGDDPTQVNGGIWVSGLPVQANLITHGQELVFPGQRVESNYDWSLGSR